MPVTSSVFSASRCIMYRYDSDCLRGEYLIFGHGPLTGNCVPNPNYPATKTCEIEAWCPVERDGLPLGMTRPMMDRVDKYTVFIKNSIAFPLFGSKFRYSYVHIKKGHCNFELTIICSQRTLGM